MDYTTIDGELRGMGAGFDIDVLAKTRELYRPFVTPMPWLHGKATTDLPYGPHERHRLDVFSPECRNAPILLFVHGGGFIGGGKSADPLFYSNVGYYFASRGYLAATMNYRLATTDPWPAGSQDVAAAIQWLRKNAATYGGDASKIVVVAQSAGTAHVVGSLFSNESSVADRSSIRAVALLSGFYELRDPVEPGPHAYFGAERGLWPSRAPIENLATGHPPVLLTLAELDPSAIASHTLALASRLNAIDGCPPALHWFAGHNHVSPVHGLGIGDDAPGRVLNAFFQQHLR